MTGSCKCILLAACSFAFRIALAQDSLATPASRPSRNLGLSGGVNWSLLALDASPYLAPGAAGTGSVTERNTPGLSGGLFLSIPQALMRVGAELTIMPAYLSYNHGRPNPFEGYVHPLTVDLPVYWISRPVLSGRSTSPCIVAGLRAVFPIPLFNSTQPELLPLHGNGEVGLRFPLSPSHTTGGIEVFSSIGLFNLVQEGSPDYRTHALNSLRSNFAGVRVYFN